MDAQGHVAQGRAQPVRAARAFGHQPDRHRPQGRAGAAPGIGFRIGVQKPDPGIDQFLGQGLGQVGPVQCCLHRPGDGGGDQPAVARFGQPPQQFRQLRRPAGHQQEGHQHRIGPAVVAPGPGGKIQARRLRLRPERAKGPARAERLGQPHQPLVHRRRGRVVGQRAGQNGARVGLRVGAQGQGDGAADGILGQTVGQTRIGAARGGRRPGTTSGGPLRQKRRQPETPGRLPQRALHRGGQDGQGPGMARVFHRLQGGQVVMVQPVAACQLRQCCRQIGPGHHQRRPGRRACGIQRLQGGRLVRRQPGPDAPGQHRPHPPRAPRHRRQRQHIGPRQAQAGGTAFGAFHLQPVGQRQPACLHAHGGRCHPIARAAQAQAFGQHRAFDGDMGDIAQIGKAAAQEQPAVAVGAGKAVEPRQPLPVQPDGDGAGVKAQLHRAACGVKRMIQHDFAPPACRIAAVDHHAAFLGAQGQVERHLPPGGIVKIDVGGRLKGEIRAAKDARSGFGAEIGHARRILRAGQGAG